MGTGKDFENDTSQGLLDLIRGEEPEGQDAMNMLRQSLAEEMIIPTEIKKGIEGFARVHESNRVTHLQQLLDKTGGKTSLIKIFVKSAFKNYPAIKEQSPAAAAVLDDVMAQVYEQNPGVVEKAVREIMPKSAGKPGVQTKIEFPTNN